VIRSILVLVVLAGVAHAQPGIVDRAACLRLDTAPGALLEPATSGGGLDTPIPWTEFVVQGDLVDSAETVHALLEPTMAQLQTTLSAARWKDVAATTAKLGYQLVGHLVAGTKIVLHLAPLPMIREVGIDVPQHWYEKLLDEEIRRRLRARRGVYLPWEPMRRQCSLDDERLRIEEYLHDEGYADARVEIVATVARTSARLRVHVDLGPEYVQGHITIINANDAVPLALTPAEIEAPFKHKKTCIVESLCFGTTRFTRSQHTEDVQKLKDLFHRHGYPSVRIQSSYDPKLSFDRRTHTVPITLTIDQRRSIDVKFEGVDPDALPDEELKKQLTFDDAGSSDDVEAAASAKALVAYLQGRGYFDARVTVERTRLPDYDQLVFHIDPGPMREVREVQFQGNHVLSSDTLAHLIATKPADFRNALFGDNVAETSAQLQSDVARIKDAYRRAGYRDVQVTATTATSPDGLDSSALAAALVLAGAGTDLYVRFRIDEGQPTLVMRFELELDVPKDQRLALCGLLLGELSDELAMPALAIPRPDASGLCVAVPGGVMPYKEDEVTGTHDRLRDFMFRKARPRAVVDYEARDAGDARVIAHYKVRGATEVKLGRVIVRGNFHTHLAIIERLLQLEPGAPLTSDALAEGARRLRNTTLFDAVNIDLPDLCSAQSAPGSCDGGDIVDAVVRVEEHYDFTSQLDLNAGYSSYNGLFGGLTWAQRNLFGYGLGFVANATYGTKITDLEATFTVPQYLSPTWKTFPFRTDLTGLYKQQITPEFGLLTTEGATIALQHPTVQQRTATQGPHSITYGLEYDYRLRTRQVDALRPIGANSDLSQVAVGTRTESVGTTIDYEARTDRSGNLAPLTSEHGFRLQGSLMYAFRGLLGGQDTFIKLSASGSKFVSIGDNLIIRFDLRYDEGFPLGGASLLPEVERFFAGGDSTVRGYNDDAMATEIVQVKVPPLGNITQIRVIPAGGNIRLLSSVDAQLRIWKVLAGAVFTDAGMISNEWSTVTESDIRPSIGTGLRVLTPFGIAALEYAVPLRPNLGDDPRGRIHFYFAARAQF
jgi:outer membrane protein insertion porin family